MDAVRRKAALRPTYFQWKTGRFMVVELSVHG